MPFNVWKEMQNGCFPSGTRMLHKKGKGKPCALAQAGECTSPCTCRIVKSSGGYAHESSSCGFSQAFAAFHKHFECYSLF